MLRFRSHQHAAEVILRQDVYSKCSQRAVEEFVENAASEIARSSKRLLFNAVRFSICTGLKSTVAPKNGVDIYGEGI
jgi:hypothetical protein